MGFLKPDSGRVIVAGQDITDYNEVQLEEIRKKVTMVFQNGALFDSLTRGRKRGVSPCAKNGELAEEQIYQVVDGLLEMVGVKEMRELLAFRPLHRHETFRRHSARARRAARSAYSMTSRRPWSIR